MIDQCVCSLPTLTAVISWLLNKWPPLPLNLSRRHLSCWRATVSWPSFVSCAGIPATIYEVPLCICLYFLPFFNSVLGFWNEPQYFVLFCRPEKISPSSTFAALCSALLCSGVKSERQVESLLRSRCGHKTSTPGTSFSWQAGAAAGICIRSHPSLTVRTCWPHWPEGALLGTYAPFHCLPAL